MSEDENRDKDMDAGRSKYRSRKRTSLEINRNKEMNGDEGTPKKLGRDMCCDRDIIPDCEVGKDTDRDLDRDTESEVDANRETDSENEREVDPPRTPENPSLEDLEKALEQKVKEYPNVAHWIGVRYYELDKRVGEEYETDRPTVNIDMSTSPNVQSESAEIGRFCIGNLSNINRSSEAKRIRSRIGYGVTFHKSGGEVYFTCNSDEPVFMQSLGYNVMYERDMTAVRKWTKADGVRKVFNSAYLRQQLADAIATKKFDNVFNLTRMATTIVSFGESWGKNTSRENATDISCWIQVDLRGILDWLCEIQEIMRQIDPLVIPARGSSFS